MNVMNQIAIQPSADNIEPMKIVFSVPHQRVNTLDMFAAMMKKTMPETCMIMKSDSSPPMPVVITFGAENTMTRIAPSVPASL